MDKGNTKEIKQTNIKNHKKQINKQKIQNTLPQKKNKKPNKPKKQNKTHAHK